ncbi:hypothetical protein TNIN_100791 [Trichonephila inaurata madagascariensis]|uniref:Uncharacterized protein n=1 Tax=Trichonephila inaurata madagascariensis TaxID=2747483 RepID=A0A8X6YRI5_9ARAC|nr:hypothetical protein TNIN_100791 [Trichonephila inaurata madagascariensis]
MADSVRSLRKKMSCLLLFGWTEPANAESKRGKLMGRSEWFLPQNEVERSPDFRQRRNRFRKITLIRDSRRGGNKLLDKTGELSLLKGSLSKKTF